MKGQAWLARGPLCPVSLGGLGPALYLGGRAHRIFSEPRGTGAAEGKVGLQGLHLPRQVALALAQLA